MQTFRTVTRFSLLLATCLFASVCAFAGNSLPLPMQRFGGVFETIDVIGNNCQNSNLLTNACTCPGGTAPAFQARVINDHYGPGTASGGNVLFCSSGGPAGSSEFLGAYQLDDPVQGGAGCRLANGLTGSCSCPANATVTSIRTLVDSSSGLISSTIGICSLVSPTPQSFAGAFQVDDTSQSGGPICRASNPFTGGCSCPTGFVNQALRAENKWSNNVGTGGTNINVCVAQVPSVAICPGQTADPTGRLGASDAINACLNALSAGSTLALPAGTYRLDSRVNLTKAVNLRTASVADPDEACGGATPCATLMAGPTFNNGQNDVAVQGAPGLLGGQGYISNIVIDHIIIDGNRNVRLTSDAGTQCARTDSEHNFWGFNAVLDNCSSCSLTSSISQNALCGTGFGWSGTSTIVKFNKFKGNGDHNTTKMWADGLTIAYADASEIAYNSVTENSDVGLIIGGALNSSVHDNTIRQDLTPAFAALMLNSFLNSSLGNFGGTTFSANTIYCGTNKCFYGVNIGDHAWISDTQTSPTLQAGRFTSNTVTGGVITVNVDGAGTAAAPLEISSNTLTNSLPSTQVGCGNDATHLITPSRFNAAPTGHSVLTANSTAPSTTQLTHKCY